MTQLRVGVLMGGKNIEREVSFNSGRTVCDHLDTTRYEIIPIFQTVNGTLYILPWHFLHRGKIADFESRLATEAQEIIWDDLPNVIDFMYIATHGRFAEDGILQGSLELLGIPYLGSSIFASAACMDKIILKTILHHHGIEVPKGITVSVADAHDHKKINDAIDKEKLNYPLIVKPHAEGSSLGISAVHEPEQLANAIAVAMHAHPEKPQPIIIEEKITGMEFSCITIVDYKKGKLLPLPPTEIAIESNSEFFTYDQKYMPGRAHKFTPPRCSKEMIKTIQDVCVRVMNILGIETIARIDGFLTKDNRIVIVDPNTLSGMAPSSFLFREAAELDMSHTDLINHLIETDLHRFGMLQKIEQREKRNEKKRMQKKLNVAVLLGGPSHEREISLESGRNIIYKLSPHKYHATPIFLRHDMKLFQLNQAQLVRNSTFEIASMVKPSQQVTWQSLTQYDFVFIGLHGAPGENGAVQGMLEMLGIPYNGSSVLTSSLCIDKFKTANFLKAVGFEVPQQLLVEQHSFKKQKKNILTKVAYPCIVKPHDDGCSVMVQRAQNEKELMQAIEQLFKADKKTVLIEEFIHGMELTVGVMGNNNPRALPPSQAVTTHSILTIEEKFLPGAGENQTPARLPEKTIQFIQQTIEHVYSAVGCKGYARIDCFYQSADQSPTGKERLVILEINTLPGLTPATCIFHQAAEIGLKPMEFIDQIVQLGLEEHSKIESVKIKKAQKASNKAANH